MPTSFLTTVGEGVVPWVNFWFQFFCVNMLYTLKCCKMLHMYLATEVYFLFNKMFIVSCFNIALYVWLLTTFTGEKVK
jgi:hypothetical protein